MNDLLLVDRHQVVLPDLRPDRNQTTRSQRYYIWTVGCQMNVSDSERLEAALQGVGYSPAQQPDEASFIVLNSCSVRASAEERILGKLGELQRIKRQYPDTQIVLWGCMVGPDNESIFKARLPMVDHFVSPSAVDQVLALAPNPIYQLDEPVLPVRDWTHPPVAVHVPIQYGCNMTCATVSFHCGAVVNAAARWKKSWTKCSGLWLVAQKRSPCWGRLSTHGATICPAAHAYLIYYWPSTTLLACCGSAS